MDKEALFACRGGCVRVNVGEMCVCLGDVCLNVKGAEGVEGQGSTVCL